MSLLHSILCFALAGACLWRWRYVSEGSWDRRFAYAAILGGCSTALMGNHWGELFSLSGMAWLIGAGAFREHRAEHRERVESAQSRSTANVKGRAA